MAVDSLAEYLPFILGGVVLLIVLVVGLSGNRQVQHNDRITHIVHGGQRVQKASKSARAAVEASGGKMEKRLRQIEKQAVEDRAREHRSISDRIGEAGWEISVQHFWMIGAGCGFGLTLLAFVMGLPMLVVLLMAPIGCFGLPMMVLRIAGARRKAAFLGAMADALEAITRAIKAGLPVSESMAIIGRDFDGPIGAEFAKAVDEQKIGLGLGEALERLAHRMPVPEMRMMSMAVTIQTQTGGSLAETLENLANVIRGRERLRRKVKAVSSEAKISAAIMGCLPLFVMGSLYLVNPDYVNILFTTDTGKILMIGCGLWMSCGVAVMWKMVNFKV
ncbi:MAG: type II secretion system F family protein [Alphaproteobacteria bacterium]